MLFSLIIRLARFLLFASIVPSKFYNFIRNQRMCQPISIGKLYIRQGSCQPKPCNIYLARLLIGKFYWARLLLCVNITDSSQFARENSMLFAECDPDTQNEGGLARKLLRGGFWLPHQHSKIRNNNKTTILIPQFTPQQKQQSTFSQCETL